MSWLDGLANGSLVESRFQTCILSLPHIGSGVVVSVITILEHAVGASAESPR
jgi:hypothetical protein